MREFAEKDTEFIVDKTPPWFVSPRTNIFKPNPALVRVLTNQYFKPLPWFVSSRTNPPWFVSPRTNIFKPNPALVRVLTNQHFKPQN